MKKYCKIVFATLVLMVFGLTDVQGQMTKGFAGDVYVEHLYTLNDGKPTPKEFDLGIENHDDCQYHWEVTKQEEDAWWLSIYGPGTAEVKEPDKGKTKLIATPGVYQCRLVRASKYGISTAVTVLKICSQIKIKSVKLRGDCVPVNEQITVDYFDIVTEPKGYQNQVRIEKGDDIHYITGFFIKKDMHFHVGEYLAEHPEEDLYTYTLEVTVISPESSGYEGIDVAKATKTIANLLTKAKTAFETFQKTKTLIEKAQKCSEKLKKIPLIGEKITVDPDVSMPITGGACIKCCADPTNKKYTSDAAVVLNGKIYANINASAHCPLPVAALSKFVTIDFGIEVGFITTFADFLVPIPIYGRFKDCFSANTLAADLYLEGQLGVTAKVTEQAKLQGYGAVGIKGTMDIDIIPPSFNLSGTFYGKIVLKGTIGPYFVEYDYILFNRTLGSI